MTGWEPEMVPEVDVGDIGYEIYANLMKFDFLRENGRKIVKLDQWSLFNLRIPESTRNIRWKCFSAEIT